MSATLKQRAIKLFNKAIAKAKDALNKAVKNAIKTAIDGIKAKIKAKIKEAVSPITDKIESAKQQKEAIVGKIKEAKETAEKAVKTFNTVKKAARAVKAASGGIAGLAKEALIQAAEAKIDAELGGSGEEVSLGETEIEGVINTVAPIKSGTPTLDVKFNGAKVKLKSIDELEKVVKEINRKLDREDASATRAWVHRIQRTHPLLDEKIKSLKYFKPISNEVGSTYLMHTPDTQTLALEDWNTEIPNPFRRTLQYKMGESYEKVNEVYYELNKAMVRNISTEYYDERKSQASNYLNKDLLSNDYHIAGDFIFAEDHVGKLELILTIALILYVGKAGKLINWLKPVNNFSQALCTGLTITVEGKQVVVNSKGDKIGVIAEVIDETAISAKECR